MNIKDICKIVEVCALSGVSEIKLGIINIKFGQLADHNRTFVGAHLSGKPGKGNTEKNHDYEATFLDDTLEEDADRAQLIIDDPVGYENEIIDQMTGGLHEGNESSRAQPAL